MKRRLAAAALAAAPLLLVPASASPHAFAPALLELREWPDGRVEVALALPVAAEEARSAPRSMEELSPVLPARCQRLGGATHAREGQASVERFSVACGPGGLGGEVIALRGLAEADGTAIVRHTSPEGAQTVAVLHGAEDALVLGTGSLGQARFGELVRMGLEHIAAGADHLLFVLCLVLLCRGVRPVMAAVTAFTAAHSLTLALAVLGLVRVPPAPVEALIALSVVMVAARAARAHGARKNPAEAAPRRSPAWPSAFAFGLLHGLGFAGALSAARIPSARIPAVLVGVNLGIELGQLAFVLLTLAALRLGEKISWTRPSWPPRALAWVAGSAGAYWLCERVGGLLGA